MPDLQPSTPTAAAMPVDAAPAFDDADYALGCECADPSLQIERWGEAPGASEAN